MKKVLSKARGLVWFKRTFKCRLYDVLTSPDRLGLKPKLLPFGTK